MESLWENKSLLYSLIGSIAAVFALACGFLPDIAYEFEIVDFPSDVSTITQLARPPKIIKKKKFQCETKASFDILKMLLPKKK